MRWSRISRLKVTSRLECFRRGADHLAAARRDAHHREAALVGAVGAEAEDAVDAGEARLIGQDLFGEALRALRLHQRGDQRDGVIGERRGAHRVLPVARAIARRKVAEAGRIRAPRTSRLACCRSEKMRGSSHSPVPSNCTRLRFTPVGGKRLHHLRHRVGAVGNEDRIDAGAPPAPRAAPALHLARDRPDIVPSPRTRPPRRATACWNAASTTVP